MHRITGMSATDLLREGLLKIAYEGIHEESRGGPVLTFPDITSVVMTNPRMRVIEDSRRDANPFFHMMEFIWMMAGENDITWLKQFNKNIETYANDGVMKAAYGHRWRAQYNRDQIKYVIDKLRMDPCTRQAVISMWDPNLDTVHYHLDKACNTTIVFRTVNDKLNMLVCNRSNDMIWGAFGANVVHMTLLHELVAHFAGVPLGVYNVISMNMHVYTENPVYLRIHDSWDLQDVYHKAACIKANFGEAYEGFIYDCIKLVHNYRPSDMSSPFMIRTALPMFHLWFNRDGDADQIEAPDWRLTCKDWIHRRATSSSATLTAP